MPCVALIFGLRFGFVLGVYIWRRRSQASSADGRGAGAAPGGRGKAARHFWIIDSAVSATPIGSGWARAARAALVAELALALVWWAVDIGDQEAADRWIAHHSARQDAGAVGDEDPFGDLGYDSTDDEEVSLADAFGIPDRLPPVRLPAEEELAALSRTAPLLMRVRGLPSGWALAVASLVTAS